MKNFQDGDRIYIGQKIYGNGSYRGTLGSGRELFADGDVYVVTKCSQSTFVNDSISVKCLNFPYQDSGWYRKWFKFDPDNIEIMKPEPMKKRVVRD